MQPTCQLSLGTHMCLFRKIPGTDWLQGSFFPIPILRTMDETGPIYASRIGLSNLVIALSFCLQLVHLIYYYFLILKAFQLNK